MLNSLNRKLRSISTIILANLISKKHKNYSKLFDKSIQIDETRITKYFTNMTKKHFPEYKDQVGNENNNPFKFAFNKYLNSNMTRSELSDFLEMSPDLKKVFDNSESIIAHLGEKSCSSEKVIDAFAFGTFFRDAPKIKLLGKPLRKSIIIYNRTFCKDWINYIAWLFSFKFHRKRGR